MNCLELWRNFIVRWCYVAFLGAIAFVFIVIAQCEVVFRETRLELPTTPHHSSALQNFFQPKKIKQKKVYKHKISKTQKERKKSNQWKLCFCKRVKDHPHPRNPWKESECVFLLFGQELLSLFYQVIVRSKHCQGDTDSAHQVSEPKWLSVFFR